MKNKKDVRYIKGEKKIYKRPYQNLAQWIFYHGQKEKKKGMIK